MRFAQRVCWVDSVISKTYFFTFYTVSPWIDTWIGSGWTDHWPASVVAIIRSIFIVGLSPVRSSVSYRSYDSCAVNFRVWACHLPSGGDVAWLWPHRSSLNGVGGARQIRSLSRESLRQRVHIYHAVAVGWHVQGMVQRSRFSVCKFTSETLC